RLRRWGSEGRSPSSGKPDERSRRRLRTSAAPEGRRRGVEGGPPASPVGERGAQPLRLPTGRAKPKGRGDPRGRRRAAPGGGGRVGGPGGGARGGGGGRAGCAGGGAGAAPPPPANRTSEAEGE